MKNKILLVQSPPWGAGSPPLGIAYLVTFLKSHGFDAEIYDLNMDLFLNALPDIKEKWETQDIEFWTSGKAVCNFQEQMDGLADRTLSFGAGVIGFSASFAAVPFLNEFLTVLRKRAGDRRLAIIVGGGAASYWEGRSLFKKELIDYFVAGEGELPLLCLMKDLQGGRIIPSDPHCDAWKDYPEDQVLCLQAKRLDLIKVDDLPFPTFEEFDMESYTQKDLIPLISSRGCIRRCAFCCDSPLKRPYRVRDPEKVAREIKYHVQKYHRKRFEFCDLLINGDLKFLEKFCDRLITMDLNVAWGGQATIRKDMGSALIAKMKKAGCGGLTFGIESFSDHVLKLTAKGVTVKDSKEMLARIKKAGIRAEINLIVGLPGETEEDVSETIDFIRQHSDLIDQINSLNICMIEPGMYIYDHLEEYNISRSMKNNTYAWSTKDMSNTIEVRTERYRRMAAAFSELHLVPRWQNLKK